MMEIEQLRILVYQHICQLTNEGETPMQAAILAFDIALCVFGEEARGLDRDACIVRLRESLETRAVTADQTKSAKTPAATVPVTKEETTTAPRSKGSSVRR